MCFSSKYIPLTSSARKSATLRLIQFTEDFSSGGFSGPIKVGKINIYKLPVQLLELDKKLTYFTFESKVLWFKRRKAIWQEFSIYFHRPTVRTAFLYKRERKSGEIVEEKIGARECWKWKAFLHIKKISWREGKMWSCHWVRCRILKTCNVHQLLRSGDLALPWEPSTMSLKGIPAWQKRGVHR